MSLAFISLASKNEFVGKYISAGYFYRVSEIMMFSIIEE